MNDMRTPLSKARGRGSAHEGLAGFLALRVSACALLILTPIFIFSLLYYFAEGRSGILAWLGSPFGALTTLLFLSAVFYHMRLGMAEIVLDYIARPLTRTMLLLLNTFICLSFWLLGVLSILMILWKGVAG